MISPEAVRQAQQRFDDRKQYRAKNIEQLANLRKGGKFDWEQVETAARLAQRARLIGLHDDAGELLGDPANKQVGQRVYEKIIGENNLLDVNFMSEGSRKAAAVARITLPVAGGTRLGTGFMVSSRIMMTNNHVIANEVEASRTTIEFDFFEREDGTIGPKTLFGLQPLAFFVTNVALDCTLVAVAETNANGVNVASRGWFPLIGPSGKAVVGERVSIIHHPDGMPQKVTLHDNKLVDNTGDFLHYQTDTMGGSSGSPVLNIDWDLIGLHHAAFGDSNEGVRISSIVAWLRQLFGNESVDPTHRVDRSLLVELLDAKKPAGGDDGGARVPPPTGVGGLPPGRGPVVNPDGSTSWVIPLSVTVGVGGGVGAGGVGVHAGSPHASPTSSADPSHIATTDDPDVRAAMDALEDASTKVYYSEVQDKEAIKAYYPDLDGLTKAQRYDTLAELLESTHTTTLSYKTARLSHLYPWIDRREASNRPLKGIYSNKTFDALEVIQREAAMERRRAEAIQKRMSQESLGGVDDAFLAELEAAHPFNCEHVVPQSWFSSRKQPKTDLHHLFTCEWGCNSFRGNHAYFDFPAEAVREDCGRREDGKFEPRGGKGAVARATLYFLIRYKGDIADSSKEMPKDRVKTLVSWAQNDKVDKWERHRNAEIQKVQGNRNPLIDFPELVDKIAFERGFAS